MANKTNNTNSSITDTKTHLAELIKKKAELCDSLLALERQIFRFEASYLQDTEHYGNIVTGWEKYATANLNNTDRKKVRKGYKESDRIFSYSSSTEMKFLFGSDTESPSNANNCPEDGDTNSNDENINSSRLSNKVSNKSKKHIGKRPKNRSHNE